MTTDQRQDDLAASEVTDVKENTAAYRNRKVISISVHPKFRSVVAARQASRPKGHSSLGSE